MVLVLDNYDSFTYNLVQYLSEIGARVEVRRNDKIGVEEAGAMNPEAIVISPGPGTPEEAGISVEAIRKLSDRIPILGVCLGHQSIGRAFGGQVVRAERLMHGKTSAISHDGRGIFEGLPNPLTAGRYHSLIVDEPSLPGCLEVAARAEDGTIMAIRHKELPCVGVQFHPESILTDSGRRMLENFLSGRY